MASPMNTSTQQQKCLFYFEMELGKKSREKWQCLFLLLSSVYGTRNKRVAVGSTAFLYVWLPFFLIHQHRVYIKITFQNFFDRITRRIRKTDYNENDGTKTERLVKTGDVKLPLKSL